MAQKETSAHIPIIADIRRKSVQTRIFAYGRGALLYRSDNGRDHQACSER